MKKYKNAFLFIAVCAAVAGMIALVNSNLSKILPDYKNEPRQYEQTIVTEETKSPSSANPKIDFTKPYTVKQACGFYYDTEILDKVYESAEDTMRRAEEKIPTETVKIMKQNRFEVTVFSSKQKTINNRRFFDITYEVKKENSAFNCYLIYSEDNAEVYFWNSTAGTSDYPYQPVERDEVSGVISSCKNLIAASGSELLAGFEADYVWESVVSTYDYGIKNPISTNYYLLRDKIKKIIIEYNFNKNEIMSFSVGK